MFRKILSLFKKIDTVQEQVDEIVDILDNQEPVSDGGSKGC